MDVSVGACISRGNPFTKNKFQTLLKYRRYLGEYHYKDTSIPEAIPAIIDRIVLTRCGAGARFTVRHWPITSRISIICSSPCCSAASAVP